MSRFVLRYRGKGKYPADTITKIQAVGASIIEDTDRMLLVDGPELELRDLFAADPDWVLAPELSYKMPDPRKTIK